MFASPCLWERTWMPTPALIWMIPEITSSNSLLDHHHLGGRQAGVCAEGRDRRERLDPLGGRRWTSSGEKTSASSRNINACNLDTLIQTSHASQRRVCGEYVWVGLMNQPNSSMSRSVACARCEAHACCLNTLAQCEGRFFTSPHHQHHHFQTNHFPHSTKHTSYREEKGDERATVCVVAVSTLNPAVWLRREE